MLMQKKKSKEINEHNAYVEYLKDQSDPKTAAEKRNKQLFIDAKIPYENLNLAATISQNRPNKWYENLFNLRKDPNKIQPPTKITEEKKVQTDIAASKKLNELNELDKIKGN